MAKEEKAEKGAGGRPVYEVETAKFQVHTTQVVVDHLKQLVATGYYGKSHNEAAEQIIRERLKELLGEEEMTRRVKAAAKPTGTEEPAT